MVRFSRVGKRTQISSNPDRAESVFIKEKQNKSTITESVNPRRPAEPKPGGRGERGLSYRFEGLKERKADVSLHCIVGKAGIGGWE